MYFCYNSNFIASVEWGYNLSWVIPDSSFVYHCKSLKKLIWSVSLYILIHLLPQDLRSEFEIWCCPVFGLFDILEIWFTQARDHSWWSGWVSLEPNRRISGAFWSSNLRRKGKKIWESPSPNLGIKTKWDLEKPFHSRYSEKALDRISSLVWTLNNLHTKKKKNTLFSRQGHDTQAAGRRAEVPTPEAWLTTSRRQRPPQNLFIRTRPSRRLRRDCRLVAAAPERPRMVWRRTSAGGPRPRPGTPRWCPGCSGWCRSQFSDLGWKNLLHFGWWGVIICLCFALPFVFLCLYRGMNAGVIFFLERRFFCYDSDRLCWRGLTRPPTTRYNALTKAPTLWAGAFLPFWVSLSFVDCDCSVSPTRVTSGIWHGSRLQ